ncbi:hypothetical protein I6E61_03420 [Psychrobacter sp. NZS113]|uniref:hypothetical protein n=1 Tax=Psychrobacter sp. NZS113 TaxID=2792045 RepID=UPI0018CD1883|nr:hypothetical protein [Psychrobacter sp. NZS113]MBH0095433.1 hypothetical protein [Psychrobacter sp. NZS113]
MQFLSVYKKISQDDLGAADRHNRVVYRSEHLRNDNFLERENDGEKFKVLRYVDDCDPSILITVSDMLELIEDIRIVISESTHDIEITNHLKEVIFMCKLCIWNINDFYLEISPWGVNTDTYPKDLPEEYRFNISCL